MPLLAMAELESPLKQKSAEPAGLVRSFLQPREGPNTVNGTDQAESPLMLERQSDGTDSGDCRGRSALRRSEVAGNRSPDISPWQQFNPFGRNAHTDQNRQHSGSGDGLTDAAPGTVVKRKRSVIGI